MSGLHQDAGVPAEGEAPMPPVMALAHGMALLGGRRAPRSTDVADAATMMADLLPWGWAVERTPDRGPAAPRCAALAACLALLAKRDKPTPRMVADAEALLMHLRSMACDLVECERVPL